MRSPANVRVPYVENGHRLTSGANPSETKTRRVVYLLGAGATQAAVDLVTTGPRVLTRHIAEQVFLKIRSEDAQELYPLANRISHDNTDIEQIITLLENSNEPTSRDMADSLRRLFRREIREQLGDFSSELEPNLYAALFDLYNVADFDETLAGVISLNYDQIADLAFAHVFGGIHYVASTVSQHSTLSIGGSLPAFVKLHGSFNWRNRFPISVADEGSIAEQDVLWLPPGLGKSKEQYPFDLLWGRAQDLLQCDTLRVIGCSLSQNDMHLVGMIFRAQLLSDQEQRHTIELINYPNACDEIANRYPYLRFSGIMDQSDFVAAVAAETFPDNGPPDEMSELQRERIRSYLQDGRVNIFERWTRMKAEALFISGEDITTDTNTLKGYIDGEWP